MASIYKLLLCLIIVFSIQIISAMRGKRKRDCVREAAIRNRVARRIEAIGCNVVDVSVMCSSRRRECKQGETQTVAACSASDCILNLDCRSFDPVSLVVRCKRRIGEIPEVTATNTSIQTPFRKIPVLTTQQPDIIFTVSTTSSTTSQPTDSTSKENTSDPSVDTSTENPKREEETIPKEVDMANNDEGNKESQKFDPVVIYSILGGLAFVIIILLVALLFKKRFSSLCLKDPSAGVYTYAHEISDRPPTQEKVGSPASRPPVPVGRAQLLTAESTTTDDGNTYQVLSTDLDSHYYDSGIAPETSPRDYAIDGSTYIDLTSGTTEDEYLNDKMMTASKFKNRQLPETPTS